MPCWRGEPPLSLGPKRGWERMEWRDVAIVLGGRAAGESTLIASLLTSQHGLQQAMVAGVRSAREKASYQMGTILSCQWFGREDEAMGRVKSELLESVSAHLLTDADRLAALTSACALLAETLPAAVPVPSVYDASLALLATLFEDDWASAYVRWEVFLLAELGYGLDLEACAATGQREDLIWVSPRSGRAVCRAAGAPYADRLLPLPEFLRADAVLGEDVCGRVLPVARADCAQGLVLTAYFLQRHVFAPRRRALPPARVRLQERLAREG